MPTTLKDLASAASDAHDAYLASQLTADKAKADADAAQATADTLQTAQHAAFVALLTEVTAEDPPAPAARVR